jgi:hypothetical protein
MMLAQRTVDYQQDYYAWAIQTACLLREGRFSEIDALRVAEELESMGKREKRELVSRLAVLVAHLLKWQFQPARRSRSWRNAILTQREEIEALLEDSPSLRGELPALLPAAFARARRLAEDETGIEQETFGETCPFTLEEILGEGGYEIL